MCFSASASFGAGAALLVAGFITVRKTKNSELLPFAAIPFIFGIQQFMEGILWLALSDPDYAHFHSSATYSFLFFAQVVWPAWVPYAFWRMEEQRGRKRLLFILTLLGFLVGCYLLYCLWNYAVDARILGRHIRYDLNFQHNEVRYSGVFYFLPTVLPALISSRPNMIWFGLLVLASFVVSKLFFGEHVISVWCYFAALISLLIYFLVKEQRSSRAT